MVNSFLDKRGQRDGQRMSFQHSAECESRTDALFRTGAYPSHVKHPTPLSDLVNFDLVLDVVISERMHLTDKGVSAKCIDMWINGHPEIGFKLT
uniref:Uncharacterized protein n=1 Tax=Anopheles christyi TaxID=43041 RepID=A0A182K9N3_9DIPT